MSGKKVQVDLNKAVGYKYPSDKVRYNRRDLLVYAAGLNLADPKFTYELDKNFAPFPTYPLVLPLKGDTNDVNSYAERSGSNADIPGLPKIDLNRLVHGEQSFEILAPIPKEGEFTLESTLIGVYDTGKGMIMDKESVMMDKNGQKLAKMVSSAFVIGAGGFGGPRKPKPSNAVDTPKRNPDAVVEIKTHENQALVYRISGDYNPLHADPRLCKKLGMDGAILHGLCFYGMSAAAVLKKFGDNDPATFRSMYGRFASPVYPGETLQVIMWKVTEENGQRAIAFVTKVKERDVVVIANGTVILQVNASSKL
ncbi:HotDog domain-containing protein [Phlyctochytrium arcticum]|nr:HotDog domain-containing protein [Phlyctochytrium arcticum]